MKNHLIIGGSSGIGAEIIELLAENDNKVFSSYNLNSSNTDTDQVAYHHLNVLDSEFNFDYLPENLNGLVYYPESINLKTFARIKPEYFLADFNLQVNGAISVLRKVLSRLKKNRTFECSYAFYCCSTKWIQISFSSRYFKGNH